MNCQEIEDVITNRHTLVLFRYLVNNKSEQVMPLFAQLRYMNSQIHLKLELFKNGVIVQEIFGTGSVNLRRSLIEAPDANAV